MGAMDLHLTSGDGTPLVARRSPGTGVPVVLVHGSGGGLHSWDPVVAHLPDDVETWAYARRGFAPSGPCTSPKTFDDDADDLAAVVAAAGGHAHVLGGSYGATVALHHALAHPGGVATLSVFEPPLFAAGPRLVPVLGEYRALADADRPSQAALLFARDVARLPEDLVAAAPPAADGPPSDEARAEMVGNLHDLEAMAADDGDLGRWAGIDVPVTLLEGAETWSPMPETMGALAMVLPRVRRVRWPGQSHFAAFTAPELVAAALAETVRAG